jgi:hypothetical protein
MEDPTASTDEVSIPTENTRSTPRMNAVVTRRKVGTKTFPWAAAAINHTPPPLSPPPLSPPPPPSPPPPSGRRMSVRRKCADLQTCYSPFSANLEDEDMPAAKKPRLETSIPTVDADAGLDVPVHALMTDALATASPSDIVAVAPRDAVTVSPPLQSMEAPRPNPRKFQKWTTEEDAKLTAAVKECGKDWVAVTALVPSRAYEQCRQRWQYSLDPNLAPQGPSRKWQPKEDAKLADAVKKHGNDWVAVATLIPGRINRQCRERWKILMNPNINRKMGKWTAEEDAKLIEGLQKHGKDWLAVAALVPGRTNSQCSHRWVDNLDPINSRRMNIRKAAEEEAKLNEGTQAPRRRRWKPEEDAQLKSAVEKFGNDWIEVAALVPGRSNRLCRARWTQCTEPGFNRAMGKWTAEEDAKLTAAVKKHGRSNWPAIAALVPGRTSGLCRGRWVDNVDPKVINRTQGYWKPKEDAKLTAAVKKCGTKDRPADWAAVAALVPGRTNDQCRARWASYLDPDIKRVMGRWTKAEDAKLIGAVKKCGKDWVAVAELVSGRTNAQCSQRWVYVEPQEENRKRG